MRYLRKHDTWVGAHYAHLWLLRTFPDADWPNISKADILEALEAGSTAPTTRATRRGCIAQSQILARASKSDLLSMIEDKKRRAHTPEPRRVDSLDPLIAYVEGVGSRLSSTPFLELRDCLLFLVRLMTAMRSEDVVRVRRNLTWRRQSVTIYTVTKSSEGKLLSFLLPRFVERPSLCAYTFLQEYESRLPSSGGDPARGFLFVGDPSSSRPVPYLSADTASSIVRSMFQRFRIESRSHDLRAYAMSFMFANGLTVDQVALRTHTHPRTVSKYYLELSVDLNHASATLPRSLCRTALPTDSPQRLETQ